MKILCGLLLVFMSMRTSGQILKNIKDRAVNKAKENTIDKARTEARNAAHKQLDQVRAEFDSTDFDYAILLSDNSGLFNVKDKREFGGKFMTLKNVGTSLYRRDFDISDEVKSMKFPGAVRPQEEITLHAAKRGAVGGLWQFDVSARVGERLVAEGVVVLNKVE